MCPYKRNLSVKDGGSLDCIHISSAALGSVGCDFDYARNWVLEASETQHHFMFLPPGHSYILLDC